MIRRPPRSTRTDTLFPYTTLFRSKTASTGAVPVIRPQECHLPDPHIPPRSSADPCCNAEAKDRHPDQLQAPPKSRGQACCGGTAEVDTTDAGETPPSGMARHTFKVSGLDCAEEVAILRSEERRVGKEWVSTGRARGSRTR